MILPPLTDREIVLLYREWSEHEWAASFMALPHNGTLPQEFLEWMNHRTDYTIYEQDLINRWHNMEGVA